jgi:hypothetical protein
LDIPVAGGDAELAEKSAGGDLDFGFLDLEVSEARAVEPAASGDTNFTLDFGKPVESGAVESTASAAGTGAAGTEKAEEDPAKDDPFYFLRKPGEPAKAKTEPPSKPAGSPKSNDKELDDFLSDLGM